MRRDNLRKPKSLEKRVDDMLKKFSKDLDEMMSPLITFPKGKKRKVRKEDETPYLNWVYSTLQQETKNGYKTYD
jgi:hypothetical protein